MQLRAVLFDYGGTLDGAGSHWLDRFLQFYAAAGLSLPFEQFRAAFDYATRCGYADPQAATFDLQALVDFHVRHHLEYLHVRDTRIGAVVAAGFLAATRAAWVDSGAVLTRLRSRIALGVISNFYGNLDRILAEAGLASLLTTVVDSTRVGLSKPDPQIFHLAVQALACPPSEVLYVGDSFEKDIVGAHAAGLRTAWLVGAEERPCRAPECLDVRLRRLADVESLLE